MNSLGLEQRGLWSSPSGGNGIPDVMSGMVQFIFLSTALIRHFPKSGGNCIKIGLPGKSILGDYFQENRTSRNLFLLLRISFPGRSIFIQFIPGSACTSLHGLSGTFRHVCNDLETKNASVQTNLSCILRQKYREPPSGHGLSNVDNEFRRCA